MGIFAFLVFSSFGLLPSSALPLAVASVLPSPTSLAATAVSTSQINLSWTAPLNNTGVSGYQIERSINASSSWSTVQSNTGSTLTSYSDTGLASHTTYTYRVSAIYSGIGISSPSNTASATTPIIAPRPPTGLTTSASSSSQINLSWTAPSDNGGSAVTGYKIERSTDRGVTWSTGVSNTGSISTTYSDSGLLQNSTYTYRVSAINSVGTSSPSSTASATTQTIPHPPTSLAANTISSSQINLSWVAPLNNGGSVITGYEIELSTDGGITWSILISNTSSTGTTFSDSGLSQNSTYTYHVSAINSVGTSSPSNTASATTQTIPHPPTGLTATASSSSQINLSWVAPSNNGGSAVTGYEIERSNSTGVWSTIVPNTGSTSTTFSDYGLSQNSTYTYRVSAINTVGTGSPSNTASATTQTIPHPPTSLAATTVSSTQINLNWTAPSNNGGSAVTGYMIERSTDGGTTWSTVATNTGSTVTTYHDIGLLSFTTYTYRVSAINSVGTSSPSNTTSATTQTVLPPPTGLAASASSSSQINLSWTAPVHNTASVITSYKIERSTDSGTTWSTVISDTGSASTSYSDMGLNPSTSYNYRVSAINSVGTSSPSNTASATTPSATITVSQPPTGLTATASSSSQINLSWTTPSYNGGSAITGYEIERSTDSGTTWSTIVPDTASISYSDMGLNPNTTYTYRVSAINSVGTSSPSSTASATTPSASPSPLPGNLVPQTPSITTPSNPILTPQIVPIPPTVNYSISQVSSGLIVSDPLNNETKSQQQLQANQKYWKYGGDAPARNATYGFYKDLQGFHIGVQTSANGTWAGYYSVTPSTNAMLFHSVISTPVSTIPSKSNWYENGMYVQNATRDVNYVECTTNTSIIGTQWIVAVANGDLFGATKFIPLWWSAMTPTEPLTRDCTIITNGDNYLKVYLDGNMVYQSNTLKLNMSSSLITFLEPQTNYAGQLLNGTFTDYYTTSGENVTVTNNPPFATTVDIVEPILGSSQGKVLATAPVDSSGTATLSIGNYRMPLSAYVVAYDSSGTPVASTSNPVGIFGGNVYSVSGTPVSYAANSAANTAMSIANSPPNVLPSPTGLAATAVSTSQISASWTAPSGGSLLIAGYKVERSTDGGVTWSTIVPNTSSASTTYLDNGLSPSTTYTYRVSAVYAGGLTSPPSNTASATTQSTTYKLTVSAKLNTGDTLTGLFTVLRNSTGQVVATGFSPATFVLTNGAQYTVGVSDFATYAFDHWADNGLLANPRSISISQDTQIAAIYKDTALTLAPSSGPAGTMVSITGVTFSPGATITLTWDGVSLATTPSVVTSDSTGKFSATFQVPGTATSGSHIVQATDGAGNTHSVQFTVG